MGVRMTLPLRPRLESLEAKTVLSAAVATAPAAVAEHGAAIVTPPFLVETPLNGSLQGNYTSHPGSNGSGVTLALLGSGQATPLGRVSASGSLAIPGFNFDVQSSGTLTLRDARGTLTLKLTGPTASGSGQLPTSFSYTTESGTGAYAHLYDSGALTLSLNQSASSGGRFTLTVASSHSNLSVASSASTDATGSANARTSTVDLSGRANGIYTSTQRVPDTGTHYQLTARGTITPVGPAVVTGSFQTPGFILNGQATGRLTLAASGGTLTLKISSTSPIAAGNSINPGGPIDAGSGSGTISGGPAILLNDFSYTITGGTGKYAHAQGTGTVAITTTPGLSSPTGPGIYNGVAAALNGSGRVTLLFTPGPIPAQS